MSVIQLRFACRRRTAAEWTTLDEILLVGEWGVETDLLPNGVKAKLGDGVTAWSALAYAVDTTGSGGGAWGSITGNLADQADLVAALAGKETTGVAAGLVATEATARANADTALGNGITAEANARAAADNLKADAADAALTGLTQVQAIQGTALAAGSTITGNNRDTEVYFRFVTPVGAGAEQWTKIATITVMEPGDTSEGKGCSFDGRFFLEGWENFPADIFTDYTGSVGWDNSGPPPAAWAKLNLAGGYLRGPSGAAGGGGAWSLRATYELVAGHPTLTLWTYMPNDSLVAFVDGRIHFRPGPASTVIQVWPAGTGTTTVDPVGGSVEDVGLTSIIGNYYITPSGTDFAATDGSILTSKALVSSGIHTASAKTTPADADELGLVDSAASNVLKRITIANFMANVWTRLGALIAGGTGKTTPADADTLPLSDSAASNATKKLTFANLATALWAKIASLTGKTTPADADTLVLSDSAASAAGKSLTFANLAATLWTKIAGLTGKSTPADADTFVLSDSAASAAGKSVTGANIKAWLWAAWGALIAAGTTKSTPVDADAIALMDSAASNATKKLTIANLKAVLAPVDVQAFSGSGTWNKPTGGQTRARVVLIGPGGGGGSGRKGAATNVRCGGGGGGSGGRSVMDFALSALGTNETVTVPAGGVGGAPQTVNSNNGNAGAAGSDTTFGAHLSAASGAGGAGGTATTGAAGAAGAGLTFSGGAGGAASASGGAGGSSAIFNYGSSGGGAGGGITNGDTPNAGGNGRASGTFATTALGGGGGSAANSGLAGGVGTSSTSLLAQRGAGGGGASTTPGTNGGAGGTGTEYGAGGGGGGAGLDSQNNSGAGGDGAPGYAVIVCW